VRQPHENQRPGRRGSATAFCLKSLSDRDSARGAIERGTQFRQDYFGIRYLRRRRPGVSRLGGGVHRTADELESLTVPGFLINGENNGWKSAEDRTLFNRHTVLFRDPPGRMIVRMNERDQTLQLQITESVIPDSMRGFSGEAAIPEMRMQPVTNLDFFGAVDFMVQ